MKRAAVLIGLAVFSLTARAADQVVTITVTIPDANVNEMVRVIDGLGNNLYTNTEVVVTNQVLDGTNLVDQIVTNSVPRMIAETPKQKFRRISARQVVRFWGGKLRQYRALQQEEDDPVATD